MLDDGEETVAQKINFGKLDYVIVASVLFITAAIGFYYVWQSQRSKNTREFLVANKGIGLWALILSAAATALSSGTLLGTPMEAYSNGVQLAIGTVAFVIGTAVAAYGTVPVLYKLNVNTINQYVEYRFNRFLRIFPAVIYLLQHSIVIAAITYVTALVLTQATGFHIWVSISLIAGLCIAYSSLGGFAAVIWTDVFQMLVIFVSFAVMLVKGTIDNGGIEKIWEQNRLGNRTTFFHWTPSPISNYTAWSLIIGYFNIGYLYAATNQSSLQRQLASKDLAGARKTVLGTVLITKALSLTAIWIGMSVYARYRDCDLFLAKRISSRDQVTASFAMEIFDNIPGLTGLYVGGILCATLSTLSSVINAFAAVTLIDFIKPLMPSLSDSRSKILSKVIGGLYGLLIFGLTGYAKHFGGIIQTLQAISGTSVGSTAVVYTLGFFVPWANTKGATIGYLVSMVFGWWLSVSRMMIGNPYTTAPMSTRGCPKGNSGMNLTLDTGSSFFFDGESVLSDSNSTIFPSEASPITMDESASSIVRSIIPVWFSCITVSIGLVVGIAISIFTGSREEVEAVNPNLISPFTKGILRQLPKSVCKRLGVSHLLYQRKFVPPNRPGLDDFQDQPLGVELQLLEQLELAKCDTTFNADKGSRNGTRS